MRPILTAVTRTPASYQSIRRFQYFHSRMGVTKTIIQEGTGPVAKKGQKVTIEYTGWLKDTSKPGNKGEK